MQEKKITAQARFFLGFIFGAAILSSIYLLAHIFYKYELLRPHFSSCEVTNIPRAAYMALLYYEKNRQAPANFIPVRRFIGSKKENLPREDESGAPITYVESDIFPNIEGVNRGVQRIVIGSNGITYYTEDHYVTFVRITPNCVRWFKRNAKYL